jgi:chemosensory pili system protein ChpA (sensor histidine kinase/response regulator)
MLDLPELGTGAALAPVVVVDEVMGDAIDMEVAPDVAHSPPTLKLVADNTVAPAPVIELDVEPVAATPANEPDDIVVGGATLSASLYKILCDEADQHVATLAQELATLQFDPQHVPSTAMIRASHTLCGIHRPAASRWSPSRPGPSSRRCSGSPTAALRCRRARSRCSPVRSQDSPTSLRASSRGRRSMPPTSAKPPVIGDELDALRQDTSTGADSADAESLAAAEAQREEEPARAPSPTSGATIAAIHAPAAPAAIHDEIRIPALEADPLAGIRDEVEPDVLPIFLDEAAELFPKAGEQVRSWRRAPADPAHALELRRTLHTFKGSARMAGAMRLGELAHLMESRLTEGELPTRISPELFEALDNDLDHIAYVLDKLRAGETNAPLPWVASDEHPIAAPEPTPEPPAAPRPVAPERPTTLERPVVVPIAAACTADDAGARGRPLPRRSKRRAPKPSSRKQVRERCCRVRADTVDRLVNEAGEVAITRARVEGELRSLKGNLLELTNSVIRLRSQVREIEIQAESQIQSRMSAVQESHEGFDALEFDRYTRFQELTRSLAEGVNDVSTVQLSLLKNLDDADAALLAQARCRAKCSSSCSRFARCRSEAFPSACIGSCAPRRESSTSERTSRFTAPRSSSTVRCSKSWSDRWSICCAMRSTTVSSRGPRAWRPASRRPARSR